MKIHHKTNDYAERRKREYPAIGDQLDAVFKLAQHLRDKGQELPPDVDRWVDQCESVKQKYPAAK